MEDKQKSGEHVAGGERKILVSVAGDWTAWCALVCVSVDAPLRMQEAR